MAQPNISIEIDIVTYKITPHVSFFDNEPLLWIYAVDDRLNVGGGGRVPWIQRTRHFTHEWDNVRGEFGCCSRW